MTPSFSSFSILKWRSSSEWPFLTCCVINGHANIPYLGLVSLPTDSQRSPARCGYLFYWLKFTGKKKEQKTKNKKLKRSHAAHSVQNASSVNTGNKIVQSLGFSVPQAWLWELSHAAFSNGHRNELPTLPVFTLVFSPVHWSPAVVRLPGVIPGDSWVFTRTHPEQDFCQWGHSTERHREAFCWNSQTAVPSRCAMQERRICITQKSPPLCKIPWVTVLSGLEECFNECEIDTLRSKMPTCNPILSPSHTHTSNTAPCKSLTKSCFCYQFFESKLIINELLCI